MGDSFFFFIINKRFVKCVCVCVRIYETFSRTRCSRREKHRRNGARKWFRTVTTEIHTGVEFLTSFETDFPLVVDKYDRFRDGCFARLARPAYQYFYDYYYSSDARVSSLFRCVGRLGFRRVRPAITRCGRPAQANPERAYAIFFRRTVQLSETELKFHIFALHRCA